VLGVSRIWQKSNTFSVTTTQGAVFTFDQHSQKTVEAELRSPSDDFLESLFSTAADSGQKLSWIMDAVAPSGGPLDLEAMNHISTEFRKSLTQRLGELSGLIMVFSGSMLVEPANDAERGVVHIARELLGNDMPIIGVFDREANISEETFGLLNYAMTTDQISSLRSILQSKKIIELSSNAIRVERVPIHVPFAAYLDPKMNSRLLWNMCDQRLDNERSNISIFTGFSGADVPYAGLSIAISNSSPERAEEISWAIRDEFWNSRQRLTVDAMNIEEAVHQAMAASNYPVIIADLGDDPSRGGPGDGTTVLWALIDLGVPHSLLASLHDPVAIAACIRAGEGAKIEIPVGGRLDPRHGYPIDIRGSVKRIFDTKTNPASVDFRDHTVRFGDIAIIEVEARHGGVVEVVLTDQRIEFDRPEMLEAIGINVLEQKIVSIKSGYRYRDGFRDVAREFLPVITPGITTPDPAFFEFNRVTRPVFPLDNI
jgi:microcystin degradation protein MlrC